MSKMIVDSTTDGTLSGELDSSNKEFITRYGCKPGCCGSIAVILNGQELFIDSGGVTHDYTQKTDTWNIKIFLTAAPISTDKIKVRYYPIGGD